MIKKKQTTSPPSKYLAASSPRNAPQEIVISDTSIREHQQMEEDVSNAINKPSAKFYSPQFRAQQNAIVQKNKSPPNKQGQGPVISNRQAQRAKSTRLSNAQQQALLELEKAKKNRVNSINDQSKKKEQMPPQPPVKSPFQQRTRKTQIQEVQKIRIQNNSLSERERIPVQEREQFQYVFPNGDKYNGTWSGKWIQGSGVYDFSKQNLQYRGEFKRSKQHGRGALLRKPINASLREDLIYEGQWINGSKQGFGKYYYFKDTYYEGQWINNMKQGQGTFISPDGQYVGEWKQNKKHGKGVLKMSNGNVFEGRWQNDQFVEGAVIYSNGDSYEGQFKNDLRDGFGVYKYSDSNTQYRGQWMNGQKHGSGTINFYNGDKYSGGMVQNKKEGNIGSYEWSTGDRVKGQFLDNLPLRGKILIKNEGQFDFDLNR